MPGRRKKQLHVVEEATVISQPFDIPLSEAVALPL